MFQRTATQLSSHCIAGLSISSARLDAWPQKLANVVKRALFCGTLTKRNLLTDFFESPRICMLYSLQILYTTFYPKIGRFMLVTKGEMRLLKSGNIDSKSYHRTKSKLNQRFPYLLDQIDFLITNPSLKQWRDMQKNVHNSDLWKLQGKLAKFMTGFTPVYLERIMPKKGPKGEHLFWIKELRSGYRNNIYNPNNLTTALKRAGFRKELIADMVEAAQHQFIPHIESRAKSEQAIAQELTTFKANRQGSDDRKSPEFQLVIRYRRGKRILERQFIEAINKYIQDCNSALKQAGIHRTIEQLDAKYEKKG